MGRKKSKTIESANGLKNPKSSIDPTSYLGKNPVWQFRRIDKEHARWSLRDCCNFNKDVLEKLHDFEGMPWSEIINTNGVDTNHFVQITDLCKEAQKRLETLKVYEDELFSLRLSNTKRLFGILNDGVFRVLWYDPKHEICPSTKKHT